MLKSLARTLIPPRLRMATYEARQTPLKRNILQWCEDQLPDKRVQSERYQQAFGRPLNWENPSTFSEKLHWLSLNLRLPVMTQCADKYAVRAFVKERGCGHVLNDLYGVWEHPDTIPFDTLPERYILKVNHGSGQNMICSQHISRTTAGMQRQLEQWMQRSEYWESREWAYKDIPPKVICEKLFLDDQGNPPPDYKFFCFNGEPHLIQVDTDRFTQHKRDLFDLQWNVLPFDIGFPTCGHRIPRPPGLDEMIDCAGRLSTAFTYVRVDFYAMGERVIFGEMTWYPGGGLERFMPEEYDTRYGKTLVLPLKG
ncbi:MAG: ATP-grasp fold amidoligase family protein [Nitrospirota bacterium]